MKKQLLSFLICLGIMMISSQTFAQALDAPGMKLKPYGGATYSYTFDVAVGLEYEFYFSNSADGINKVGLINDLASIMTGAVGTVDATNPASVSIAWADNAAATYPSGLWLFVDVHAADETTICHNYNAVFIQPLGNNFDVLVTNDLTNTSATSDVCPDLTGFKAVVAPIDVYNSGTTAMNFTFTRTGSTNAWNLDFDIKQVGTGGYTYSLDGGTTKTSVLGGATPTTITNTAETGVAVPGNTQTLQIILNNKPGDRPEFTVTVTDATDASTSVSAKTVDPSVVETVKIMPVIGGFN
ncbi:hypothetical protein ACXR6G_13885 [Ancylomarina sp. YFZ004]